MTMPEAKKQREPRVPVKRRLHETGGSHDYGGNPDLSDEANDPGDRTQGSDGRPVTGKP